MCSKDYQILIQVTRVKNTDYCRQNSTKRCDGKTAENQAGTSKSKRTNTKFKVFYLKCSKGQVHSFYKKHSISKARYV